MKRVTVLLVLISTFLANQSVAEGWCTIKEGFSVTTHGRSSEDVWINGFFENETANKWIQIASTDKGSASVAVALAALASGKKLSIYINEDEYTCGNLPSWYDGARHVRIQQ